MDSLMDALTMIYRGGNLANGKIQNTLLVSSTVLSFLTDDFSMPCRDERNFEQKSSRVLWFDNLYNVVSMQRMRKADYSIWHWKRYLCTGKKTLLWPPSKLILEKNERKSSFYNVGTIIESGRYKYPSLWTNRNGTKRNSNWSRIKIHFNESKIKRRWLVSQLR